MVTAADATLLELACELELATELELASELELATELELTELKLLLELCSDELLLEPPQAVSRPLSSNAAAIGRILFFIGVISTLG
jgi:hypothetical protein